MNSTISNKQEIGGARRWWAFGAVMLAEVTVGLDLTVLSVALPTLSHTLRASESDLQWFSSGYALVLAAAMLPAGLLGDRYGRKRVLLASLTLFAAGSLACAYAQNAGEFIAARALLGLAGAGLAVMAVSVLTVLFTPQERPRAVLVWAAANMISFPAGPVLGGWLLSHDWWGWVFLMNVPVAGLGLVAAAALVPESSSAQPTGLDLAGIAASSAGLAGLTYGLIQAGQHGWGSAGALAWMAGGLALTAVFLGWEHVLGRRGGQPLLDLALLRSAAFTWGAILAAVLFLSLVGLLFTMPQYFQGVLGASAAGSGVRLVPVMAGLLGGLAPAEVIAGRAGAKVTVAAGFAVLGVGLGLGATTTTASTGLFAATWMAVAGAGAGLVMATATSAALAELPADRAGVGSAVQQAVRNAGAPFGSAVLGSALTAAYVSRLRLAGLSAAAAHAARESVFGADAVAAQLRSPALLASARAAFVHGMDVSLLVSLGFAVTGMVAALAFMPVRAGRLPADPAGPRGGERAAAEFPA